MKYILLIGLAIVFCVSTIHCIKRMNDDEVNKLRLEKAKKDGFSNMNEVRTSPLAERLLQNVSDHCHPPPQIKEKNVTYYVQFFAPNSSVVEFITGSALATKFGMSHVGYKCGDGAWLVIMDAAPGGFKKGKLGSECAEGRKANEDGLCRVDYGNMVYKRDPEGEGPGNDVPEMSVLMSIFTVIFAFFVN